MIFALQNQKIFMIGNFQILHTSNNVDTEIVNGLGQIFECNQTKARGLYKKAKSCGILQYT